MRLGRRRTAAAALTAAILALSACSSDDGSDAPDSTGSPAPTAPSGGQGGPAALGALPPAAAPGSGGSYYVAMGDSYAAGVRIPETVPDAPGLCSRSASNYPHLTARTLAVPTFTDVTCGGATTEDLAAPQGGGSTAPAPQFEALGPQTRLVTLGIGGNDIGFTEIVTTCVVKSGDTSSPTPCKDAFTKNGQDVLTERIRTTAGKIDAALTAIHEKSPQARVLLVGYPAILPETGTGCPAQFPVAAGDLGYLRGVLHALNTMISERAAAGNAGYVDTYAPAVGHDVCTPNGTKWVEGLNPESPAAQVHPNALGHEGMAAVVIDAARQQT
ncbi:SGNH/GDSL hydrolase family protein [Yinghuangia sp. ASG 101]|uniref:SGNH/GDSL hydrolase family protein n=1 Tax=Yinghuangia sp. ASG 101 TaxID=2896848 RepID=UPI001E289591|nr:SGNH/GDSL hydrolase family protein [Yinghuangia sp. ASG 101]UGQ13908.1 SGNH/GDSL hydrolase family protein [Yinghuangia sp. ASG 101]